MYVLTFVRKDDMEQETYHYKERYDAELHFATHICNRTNDFKWISIASQPTSSDSLVLVEQIAVFDRDGVSTLFFTGGSVVKTPVPSDIPADNIKRYKLCGINGKNCSGIIFPLDGDAIKDKPEKIRLQRLRPVEYRAIFTKES